MRHIDEIMVHCTATPPSWMKGQNVDAKRDEIARWHTDDRGWKAIGYHEIIDRNGDTAIGRDLDKDGDPWEHQGAHVSGHNKNSIGISLVGGHGSSETDNFLDNFTVEQDAVLRRRIAELKAQFPSIKKVSGHNEYAAKACPGFNVTQWLNGKPSARTSITQSKTVRAIGLEAANSVLAQTERANEVVGEVSQTVGIDPKWIFLAVSFAILAYIYRERWLKWVRGIR